MKGAGNYAGPAFEIVDCDDNDLLDGDTAASAIAQLHQATGCLVEMVVTAPLAPTQVD